MADDAEPPWLVALEGPSASGKTSIAAALGRRLDAEVLAEAYERLGRAPNLDVGSAAELTDTERTLLEEEARRWGEARRHREAGRAVVLDTGVLGPLTYTYGLRELGLAPDDLPARLAAEADARLADGRFGLPDLTVYLDVDEATADWRAAQDPDGHPAALRPRHRRVARVERHLYLHGFPRYLPGRFASADGEGAIDRVTERIVELLELARPATPAEPEEARRLLLLFEERAPAGTGAFADTADSNL